MINIIVAYDRAQAIGRDNGLLWKPGEMRADMARFRHLTTGAAVIMGRKTLESIGAALPNRQNIVISRSTGLTVPGVDVVRSLSEAYDKADSSRELFVIGGGTVYSEVLDDAERVYATEVGATILRADTFFPALAPSKWRVVEEENFVKDTHNIYDYRFVTYDRI